MLTVLFETRVFVRSVEPFLITFDVKFIYFKIFNQFSSNRAIIFSGRSDSNVSSLNGPNVKPLSSFYKRFNTSNSDDDSIKHKQADMETSILHDKSM